MSEEQNPLWYTAGKRPREDDDNNNNNTNCRCCKKNDLNEEENFRDTIIYYCSKIINENGYIIDIKDVETNKKLIIDKIYMLIK